MLKVLRRSKQVLISKKVSHSHRWRSVKASDCISVHPEVEDVVRSGGPVVAFESTIITHGMPYPENLRTAQALERMARDQGVLPATVGVLEGKICVGLTPSQLEELASGKDVIKIPKRELAWAVSQQLSGGTTVSATMFAAHRAGIPLFATGGIGGVHRGGETTLDISSDLTELGRTPVCVVSAGVKSILDIPKTLEFLEMEGVTVTTYGPSKEFPAFYSPRSGVEASINMEDAPSAAKLIDLSLSLDLGCGILIAVPIPDEFAKDGHLIDSAIQQGVIESQEAGMRGKEVTPFILKRVNELTRGKALKANIALIKNNTLVACAIAKELAALQKKRQRCPSSIHQPRRTYSTFCRRLADTNTSFMARRHFCCSRSNQAQNSPPPVVIGASIVDFVASLKSPDIMYGGPTNNGSLQIGFGGVARNIADCMSRFGVKPFFISALGNDIYAQSFMHRFKHMNLDGIVRLNESTATYCLVIDDNGDVLLGIGDLDINDSLSIEHIMRFEDRITEAPLVVLDGNTTPEVMNHVCKLCSEHHIPVWFEPTCVKKASKPFQSGAWKFLSYTSPNLQELRTMYAALEGNEAVIDDGELSLTDKLEACLRLSERLLHHIYCLVITLDQDGVLVVRRGDPGEPFISGRGNQIPTGPSFVSAVHYPPLSKGDIVSVSGAGDCLAAGMIVGILRGLPPDACVRVGLRAASRSLTSPQSVPASIKPEDAIEDSISGWSSVQPNRMV